MGPRKTLMAAAFAAGAGLAALAAPAGEDALGRDKLLDYERVQRALPQMSEIGDQATADMLKLHELTDKLDTGLTTPERKQVREEIGETIRSYMGAKQQTKKLLAPILGIRTSKHTDEEVMRIIHETELHEIHWNDVPFRKCIKDLSGALGIKIRMAYNVVQMNMITMDFRSANASTILGSLCNYFQLRYVIQDGEVMLFKRLTPNEERFLEYQEKHPTVKLKYWERESASGEYKKEKKNPVKKTVASLILAQKPSIK